jgi:hypothetical protein
MILNTHLIVWSPNKRLVKHQVWSKETSIWLSRLTVSEEAAMKAAVKVMNRLMFHGKWNQARIIKSKISLLKNRVLVLFQDLWTYLFWAEAIKVVWKIIKIQIMKQRFKHHNLLELVDKTIFWMPSRTLS